MASKRVLALLLMANVPTLATGATELTPETFDAQVFSPGKSAFIKFLAPW